MADAVLPQAAPTDLGRKLHAQAARHRQFPGRSLTHLDAHTHSDRSLAVLAVMLCGGEAGLP